MRLYISKKYCYLEWFAWISLFVFVANNVYSLSSSPNHVNYISVGISFGLFFLTYGLSMKYNPNDLVKILSSQARKDPNSFDNNVIREEYHGLKEMINISGLHSTKIGPTFKEYCSHCTEMLDESQKNGHIYTVQTPSDPAIEDSENDFETYLEKTAKKILENDNKSHKLASYQRLVIVDPDYIERFRITEKSLIDLHSKGINGDILSNLESLINDKPIIGNEKLLEKIKEKIGEEQISIHKSLLLEHFKNNVIKINLDKFINAVFDEIKEISINKKEYDFNPSLDHLIIGLVGTTTASKIFYSNIDIHITSPWMSSIAFQNPNDPIKWGVSLHLNEKYLPFDTSNIFREKLEKGFDSLWDECTEFRFKEEYKHKELEKIKEEEKTNEHINEQCDNIKIKLNNMINRTYMDELNKYKTKD